MNRTYDPTLELKSELNPVIIELFTHSEDVALLLPTLCNALITFCSTKEKAIDHSLFRPSLAILEQRFGGNNNALLQLKMAQMKSLLELENPNGSIKSLFQSSPEKFSPTHLLLLT